MIRTIYKYDNVRQYIAKYLCGMNVGDKMFTYEEMSSDLGVGRGTIQQAVQELIDRNCITYSNHGRNGRILNMIDYPNLIRESGIESIVGAMPLPYSKRYEGLATGINTLLNKGGINTNLAFMSGSKNRIELLKKRRYDFCILSMRTASELIRTDSQITLVQSFKDNSFMDNFVIITRDDVEELQENARIGVDLSSDDQVFATMRRFSNENISLVPIKHSNLSQSIIEGRIDAAIWSNKNVVMSDERLKIYEILSGIESASHTQAAVVCLSDNKAVKRYLDIYLDTDKVEQIQNDVLTRKTTASY